ncbi:MAG: hypothetical protein KA163_05025 [Bacteroidia bacterium]|nr:hypothetical protein [Bacteroidia bacterium]
MRRKAIIVFYKPGTVDCYTGIVTKTGDVFGFNHQPFHPQGFGQFCGNVTDRMNTTFGYGWRNQFDEKIVLRAELAHYLNEAKSNPEWLGKEITLTELSEQAQKYLNQLLND